MLYQQRSFTVPASEAKGNMCKEKGHSATDCRGRCFCCGEKVGPSLAETTAAFQSRMRPVGMHRPTGAIPKLDDDA